MTWCYLGSATVSEQLGAVDLARRIARQQEHGFTDLVRLNKPKAKAGNASPGDTIRTPDSHPADFAPAGNGKKKNVNTGDIWSPSNTNHSNSDGGEWKVGRKPGVPARPGSKVTVSSSGTVIKVD